MAQGPTVFPDLVGRALTGDEVPLPAGLPAPRTLCLLAFQQMHQGCVDRWIARAEGAGVPGSPRDMQTGDEACVVEIPVIGTRWRLGRRFIDGGMAASIRVPRVLARTITVYTDVAAVQRALDIPDSRSVQAIVVTPHGAVLARAAGEPTDEAWGAVAAVLLPTQ